MINILRLLRSSEASSNELRVALPAINVLDARRELDRLHAQRPSILVLRDDRKLAAHDTAIAKARVEYDRVIAEQAALETKIAATEAQEHESAVMAARDKAEQEAQDVAKILKSRYPKLAAELVALLERLMKAESVVRDANASLVALGRPELTLSPVEERSLPAPQGEWHSAHSIVTKTTLRNIPGISQGWNDSQF
jgi:hypothetical protein